MRVWKNPWRPQAVSFVPQPRHSSIILHDETRVGDFFLPGTHVWDESKVRQTFQEGDADSILNLYLSATS